MKQKKFKEILNKNSIKDKYRNILNEITHTFEKNKNIISLEKILNINNKMINKSKSKLKEYNKKNKELKHKKYNSNFLNQIILQKNQKNSNIHKLSIHEKNKKNYSLIKRKRKNFNLNNTKIIENKIINKFKNPLIKIPENKVISLQNFCNFYRSKSNFDNNFNYIYPNKINKIHITTKSNNITTESSDKSYSISKEKNIVKNKTKEIKNRFNLEKWKLIKNNYFKKKCKIKKSINRYKKIKKKKIIKNILNRNYHWIYKINELLKEENLFYKDYCNGDLKENIIKENFHWNLGYYTYYKNKFVKENRKFKNYDFNYEKYIEHLINKYKYDIEKEKNKYFFE